MDERKLEGLCVKTDDKNEVSVPQNGDDSGKSYSGPLDGRNGANQKQTENDLSKIPFPTKDMDLIARGAAIPNNNENFGLQNVPFDSTEDTTSWIRPLSERSIEVQATTDSATTDLIPSEVLQTEKRVQALLLDLGEENEACTYRLPSAHLEKLEDAGQTGLSQEYSAVPQRDSISDCCINDFMRFPSPPTTSPCSSLCDSTDAGQTGRSPPHSTGCSSASSKSFSKSYVYSSASVDSTQPIPDPRTDGYGDTQILIPMYKSDGNGYCWPIKILPLGGNLRFDENKQWVTGVPIGQGASGSCYRASILADNQNNSGNLCVKKVSLLKYKKEEVLSLYLSAKDQKEAQSIHGSNNIVPFYGATYWKKEIRIFMEFMEGETVQDFLKDQCRLHKDLYMQYLADVLSALNFLHSKGIVHNDVKSANVLLDRYKLQAKLADFGNASPIFDNERLQLIKKDVWSAGCFLLEMINCCDRTISSMRFGANAADLPHHDDTDTNDIIQLFFGNKSADEQYNANVILREINLRGYKS